MEHKNERVLKETKHKINMIKMENDKYNELSSTISKSNIILGKT